MKFYNIDMQGRFLVERVVSDPSVNASYVGRTIYNTTSNDVKIQTPTVWAKLWTDQNIPSLVTSLNDNGGILLSGQAGSYYTNAGNMNAGTLPVARLAGTYNINISGTAAYATHAYYS